VGTTWTLVGRDYYLIDLVRDRWDYPTLKARATSFAQQHRPNRIRIEDTGVGTALIAELQKAHLHAIAVKPEHNKVTRMSIQSAKFEERRVWFPKHASWLADLESELFAFPNGRHDDQVDSISQALAHELTVSMWNEKNVGNLERLGFALGQDLRPTPSRSSFKAMGIGGIQAYLLGLS
jgi:predicted phage terminase large subunit-like protein